MINKLCLKGMDMLNNTHAISDDVLYNVIIKELDKQFLKQLTDENTAALKEIFEMRKYYEKIYQEKVYITEDSSESKSFPPGILGRPD